MRLLLTFALTLLSVSGVHAQSMSEPVERPPGTEQPTEPSEGPEVSFSFSAGVSFGASFSTTSTGSGFEETIEDIDMTGAVFGAGLHVQPATFLRFNVRLLLSYLGMQGSTESFSEMSGFLFDRFDSEGAQAGLLAQLDAIVGHFTFGPLVRLNLWSDFTRDVQDLFLTGGLALGVRAKNVEINVIGTYGISSAGFSGGQVDLLVSFFL